MPMVLSNQQKNQQQWCSDNRESCAFQTRKDAFAFSSLSFLSFSFKTILFRNSEARPPIDSWCVPIRNPHWWWLYYDRVLLSTSSSFLHRLTARRVSTKSFYRNNFNTVSSTAIVCFQFMQTWIVMDGWIQNNYEWEGMGMPISEGIIKFFYVFPILREPFWLSSAFWI